jgi:short chain dehydrogenase
MTDFSGRVAIVTGAARGLGRAAAARLHERGAAVAVNVRDRGRAEAVARSIGEHALAVPGDIAAAGVPDEIVRLTLERFGRVDILVNNAALARSTRFPVLSAEEWREALEVNLTAPFLLTKAVLPAMKAQQYGRIVNVSSSAGRTVSTLGGGALHRVQGRSSGADQGGRKRVRPVWHHGERGLSRDDRHGADARERNAGVAGATSGELSGAATRHRAGGGRPDLLRGLRGGGLHHRRRVRHQRWRLDDVARRIE